MEDNNKIHFLYPTRVIKYAKEKIQELRQQYIKIGGTGWVSDQTLIEADKVSRQMDRIEYNHFFAPNWSDRYIAGIDPYDEDAVTDVQYLTASEVMARFEECLTPEQKECIKQQLAAVQKNVKG